jgi:hypothetical protein
MLTVAACVTCAAPFTRAEEKPLVGATPVAATAPAATSNSNGLADIPFVGAFYAVQPAAPSKASYLGLNTSPAPAALQKQLQLKTGVGLVVDAVDADSPAAKAGVKEFDVLHKLDDQLLINNEQLAVLVRSMEVGREVKLTVIREGKPQTMTAKLSERTLQPLRLRLSGINDYRRGGAGGEPLVASSGVIVGGDVAANLDYGALGIAPAQPQMLRGILLNTPDGKQKVSAARVTIEDEKHKLSVSTGGDGHKRLKVQDKAGRVLFDGPIETKADLDKVPTDLRRAYEQLLIDVDAGFPTTQPSKVAR